MEFWEYMDKVGMMHVGQGRKHPLHIEYVHMGVLLGFVQDVMVEAILSHPRLTLQLKIRVVKAIGKVLWIQNGKFPVPIKGLTRGLANGYDAALLDLFAKWYVRDGEEFLTGAGDKLLGEDLEPEGVLHGKKIIHTESDQDQSDQSDDDETAPGSPETVTAAAEGLKIGRVELGDHNSKGKLETRIPRVVKRGKAEEGIGAGIGGCPFSGLVGTMDGPAPHPVGSAK